MDRCPECNNLLSNEMIEVNMCWECGCILDRKWHDNEVKEQKLAEINAKERVEQHIITTGYNIEGYKIVSYLDVVSGDMVLGTGLLSEFSAGISDMLGTKSESFTRKISQAKTEAKKTMIENSIRLGGNAIIGMRFSIVSFANNMIGICGEGTSVIIEKIRTEN